MASKSTREQAQNLTDDFEAQYNYLASEMGDLVRNYVIEVARLWAADARAERKERK